MAGWHVILYRGGLGARDLGAGGGGLQHGDGRPVRALSPDLKGRDDRMRPSAGCRRSGWRARTSTGSACAERGPPSHPPRPRNTSREHFYVSHPADEETEDPDPTPLDAIRWIGFDRHPCSPATYPALGFRDDPVMAIPAEPRRGTAPGWCSPAMARGAVYRLRLMELAGGRLLRAIVRSLSIMPIAELAQAVIRRRAGNNGRRRGKRIERTPGRGHRGWGRLPLSALPFRLPFRLPYPFAYPFRLPLSFAMGARAGKLGNGFVGEAGLSPANSALKACNGASGNALHLAPGSRASFAHKRNRRRS